MLFDWTIQGFLWLSLCPTYFWPLHNSMTIFTYLFCSWFKYPADNFALSDIKERHQTWSEARLNREKWKDCSFTRQTVKEGSPKHGPWTTSTFITYERSSVLAISGMSCSFSGLWEEVFGIFLQWNLVCKNILIAKLVPIWLQLNYSSYWANHKIIPHIFPYLSPCLSFHCES